MKDCPAFSFRDADIAVGEVVRAAHFRDELRGSANEVAFKIACQERAVGENLEADEASLEAMVERFRYEHDLISAEETEAWLEVHGMTAEEFQAHFDLCYWRDLFKDKVIAKPVNSSEVFPELIGLLTIDLFMAGTFTRIATALSRRLIAGGAAEIRVGAPEIATERERFLERTCLEPDQVPAWLNALERSPEWLEGMLEAESIYRKKCAALMTPDRLSRALALERLPLTRIEFESVEFDSIDAAREAHLCVRHDGLSLEDIARETRSPFKRHESLAEDLPEDQRQKMLCAVAGEVQDPQFAGGIFYLSRVLRKTEPSLADASIKNRLEQRILEADFPESSGKEFHWFIR